MTLAEIIQGTNIRREKNLKSMRKVKVELDPDLNRRDRQRKPKRKIQINQLNIPWKKSFL
jgi:hypothetical protein